MSVNLRYPNITAVQPNEQLSQIKSYLHQLVDQLNYELPAIGTANGTATYEVQGGEMSYYELRSLIISTADDLKDQYEKLYKRLETDYTGKAEFNALSNELNALGRTVNTLWASATNLEAEDRAIKTSISNLSNTVKDLKSATDAVKSAISAMNDFVKEAGTSDGWSYKKWNEGTCELFGTFTLTTTSDATAVGSMFCSDAFVIQAPFAIDGAVVTGTADGMFLITDGGTDGGNSISFVLLRPETFGTGTNVVVKLHVVGTYNPGGIE